MSRRRRRPLRAGAGAGRRDAAAALHHRAALMTTRRYQTVYARPARLGGGANRRPALHRCAVGAGAGRPRGGARSTLDVGLGHVSAADGRSRSRSTTSTASATACPSRPPSRWRRRWPRGRRVVAVGTTTVRVLESVFGEPRGPLEGRTRLLITPGFRFRAVGALRHQLPSAALDAAGAGDGLRGRRAGRQLYRTAVAERYRFYSFGDAMPDPVSVGRLRAGRPRRRRPGPDCWRRPTARRDAGVHAGRHRRPA